MTVSPIVAPFADRLSDAFLRYVRVNTQSNRALAPTKSPSTDGQLVLLEMLGTELRDMGVPDVEVTPSGFLYARLPASKGVTAPPLAIYAHVDTTDEQPGDVKPVVHREYDGGTITFSGDATLRLDPDDFPELLTYVGGTIFTSDGTSLLGADDKGGVAVARTLLQILLTHPEIRHPEIVVCFSPDEETGGGMREVDHARLPTYGFTLDGPEPGCLEAETWEAMVMRIRFKGRAAHPGYAKGKMISALFASCRLVSSLPESEWPQTTEGRDGFFLPKFVGVPTDEEAGVDIYIRDYTIAGCERRVDMVKQLCVMLRLCYPGLEIEEQVENQYPNMLRVVEQHPVLLELAEGAIIDSGLAVIRKSIRGGTDGSKLTLKGKPTPNLGVGMAAIHSRREWIALEAMLKATEVLVNLVQRWSSHAWSN